MKLINDLAETRRRWPAAHAFLSLTLVAGTLTLTPACSSPDLEEINSQFDCGDSELTGMWAVTMTSGDSGAEPRMAPASSFPVNLLTPGGTEPIDASGDGTGPYAFPIITCPNAGAGQLAIQDSGGITRLIDDVQLWSPSTQETYADPNAVLLTVHFSDTSATTLLLAGGLDAQENRAWVADGALAALDELQLCLQTLPTDSPLDDSECAQANGAQESYMMTLLDIVSGVMQEAAEEFDQPDGMEPEPKTHTLYNLARDIDLAGAQDIPEGAELAAFITASALYDYLAAHRQAQAGTTNPPTTPPSPYTPSPTPNVSVQCDPDVDGPAVILGTLGVALLVGAVAVMLVTISGWAVIAAVVGLGLVIAGAATTGSAYDLADDMKGFYQWMRSSSGVSLTNVAHCLTQRP